RPRGLRAAARPGGADEEAPADVAGRRGRGGGAGRGDGGGGAAGRVAPMTAPVRRTSGGRGAMVPPVEVRTYYDQPVIKPPVWTWEVPTYFFVGGLGGASSVLAVLADLRGERRLARVA